VLGLAGAGLVILSCFLPKIESSAVLHIAGNSLMSNGDGFVLILIALAVGAAAIRSTPDRASAALILFGLVLIAMAFHYGSADQVRVVNGLGETVDSSPGPAVWTLGLGGLLAFVAGVVRSPSTAPAVGTPG
jgi:hypothetical protein